MNRLTNSTKSIIEGTATPIDVHKEQLIYLKLKSLEDIEKEIGINLITLFKATQQGIWVKRNKDFYFFDNLIVDFKCKCLVQIVSNDEVETFPFDSYGEDWTLTREELEDDK